MSDYKCSLCWDTGCQCGGIGLTCHGCCTCTANRTLEPTLRDTQYVDLYVAGGAYRDHMSRTGRKFSLVHPSRENFRPYVVPKNSLRTFQNLTRHHSHIYRLEFVDNSIYAVLHQKSFECEADVEAVQKIKLSGEWKQRIQDVIQKGDFLEY